MVFTSDVMVIHLVEEILGGALDASYLLKNIVDSFESEPLSDR